MYDRGKNKVLNFSGVALKASEVFIWVYDSLPKLMEKKACQSRVYF
jgi:hypothetical protein